MNDIVLRWISERSSTMDLAGPVVEFGSLQVPGQEGDADVRRFFPGLEYIGCDLRPGPGVDRVTDIERSGIEDDSVGTVVCLETLEHVKHPWLALAEVFRILEPRGTLLLSVPFHHPVHDYPHDFWRMTPEALLLMLDEAGFVDVVVIDSGEQVPWDEAWDKPESEHGTKRTMPYPFMTFATARKPAEGFPEKRAGKADVDESYFLVRIDDLVNMVNDRDVTISRLEDEFAALSRYKDSVENEISDKNAELDRASEYARKIENAYHDALEKLESALAQVEMLNAEIERLRKTI